MSDPVTRLNTALEGRYRIESEFGEGGMATVYVAKDLKHNRNVALKVLKPELAAVVGADRFLVEIEKTANLQNIGITEASERGWAATSTHAGSPRSGRAIHVGSATPATTAGETVPGEARSLVCD